MYNSEGRIIWWFLVAMAGIYLILRYSSGYIIKIDNMNTIKKEIKCFLFATLVERKDAFTKRITNITFKNYVATIGMYTNDRESCEINFTHQSQRKFLPYV